MFASFSRKRISAYTHSYDAQFIYNHSIVAHITLIPFFCFINFKILTRLRRSSKSNIAMLLVTNDCLASLKCVTRRFFSQFSLRAQFKLRSQLTANYPLNCVAGWQRTANSKRSQVSGEVFYDYSNPCALSLCNYEYDLIFDKILFDEIYLLCRVIILLSNKNVLLLVSTKKNDKLRGSALFLYSTIIRR